MLVKFQTSDNILDWTPQMIQTGSNSEIFCFVKLTKGERMNLIESELDAIKRVELLRQLNESVGIIKSPRFYDYAKLAMMEQNDMGIERQEEHFFRNTQNEIINISFN